MIKSKAKAYFELLKFRLSFLVAFSSGFGYLLGSYGTIDWSAFMMLCFGGFLVSGASVTINQIIEKDLDKLMKRTESRPLPTGRLSINEALVFSVIVGIVGFGLLYYYTNPLTTILSFVSLLLYSFVYTPLKRVGPIAVFCRCYSRGITSVIRFG